MNRRVLFIGSCIALITSAFTFIIRGDILPELGEHFALNQEERGLIAGAAFLGMFASMLVGAPLCDYLGMKRILLVAFISHMVGVFGTIFAPEGDWAFRILYASTFLAGCGNGLVEIAINPLAATLYPTQKTHYLNILHAWWPGGLILGGLIARFIGGGFDLGVLSTSGLGYGWQVRMALIIVPGIVYAFLLLPLKFPDTERVASGVSTGAMFGQLFRPLFLIMAFCMLLTAATELGPQQWQESVITRTTDGRASGTMILVYTSTLMFILRHFAGPLAKLLSPMGMLTVLSGVSGVGLYLLSTANTAVEAFGYATIYGLGIAYFWPTMLGITAERFPKGGAFVLGIMGSVGNLSIAAVLPAMGYVVDYNWVQDLSTKDPAVAEQVVQAEPPTLALRVAGFDETKKIDIEAVKQLDDEQQQTVRASEAVGLAMAFRYVSALPILLVIIFGMIALYDRARGGYKPEILISKSEEAEMMSGGVEGPVE